MREIPRRAGVREVVSVEMEEEEGEGVMTFDALWIRSNRTMLMHLSPIR